MSERLDDLWRARHSYLERHIRDQREELKVLNEVIARRKRGTRHLHDRLNEARALHVQVNYPGGKDRFCSTCDVTWPCPTFIALQPSVTQSTMYKEEE